MDPTCVGLPSTPDPRWHHDEVEVVCVSVDGTITAVNDAWTAFCERSGGDPVTCGVGASYLAVCDHADDAVSERIGASIRAAARGNLTQVSTVRLSCQVGEEIRWFDVTVMPRLDDDGSPLGATVALAPISPPGAARASGAASGLLRDLSVWELVEAAPDGMVVVSAEGTISYVNRQLEQLAGYRRSELLGQPLSILLPDAVRPRHGAWEAAYALAPEVRMMGSDAERQLEPELRRADGSVVPVEISLAPIRVGLATMVAASIRDVRDQRAADRARQQLLAILDLDPDAVYVVDSETTTIEYVNSGALELLGYRREELLGRRLLDLSPEASDEQRRWFIEEHHRIGPGHRHEVSAVRRAKDGTLVPCDSRGQLIRLAGIAGDSGPSEKFLIVDRDARERRARAREIERRREVAEVVAELATLVLADASPAAVGRHLVERISGIFDSENASLVLPDPTGLGFTTVAAVGPAASLHLRGEVALDRDTIAAWARQPGPFIVSGPPSTMPDRIQAIAGPGIVAVFPNQPERSGILSAFRASGREAFEPVDAALLGDLTRQVTTALALGEARAAQQRVGLVEDRQRIARDLHDTVIQDLLGVGMELSTEIGPTTDAPTFDAVVERLETAIRRLRTVVFDARDPAADGSVSTQLRSTVAEAARSLGFAPHLVMTGPVDGLEPSVTEHLLPALREALSNVARHAHATSANVAVTVLDGRVTLDVIDDGRGPQPSTGGIGLVNLDERAALLGGSAELTEALGGGSRLLWTVRRPGRGRRRPPGLLGSA